ncbi:carbonic anhydrase 2 [Drosophila grimshawi]|uniref:carbonic anhydrase n=1 Tax=Drosophila grimshawi TaxID=7222 RepID=B4IWN5_DROGR|nr:carbonic anhydrase 2 [Drosophila grimshawi]EDV96261.1 GH16154 [Drosophila grimshawi]
MWKLRFVAGVILTCVAVVSAQDFGYGGVHGPDHWRDDYKYCSGKYQSPINIDVLNVTMKEYPVLEYLNFDEIPKDVHVTNNGHTVLVTMDFKKGKEPRIRGGPLERKTYYQFEQFHFHWGENDTIGSEDLINNRAFPAELHCVFRSLDYPNFASALGKDHGVAVLAYFFKIDEEYNYDYGEFTELLKTISSKGKSSTLAQRLPLMKFLGMDSINYFSYIGSLTTPPCAEEVVWVDYSEPITISKSQLNHFRELTSNDEHLKNNFRPTQPLNNRIVYKNDPPVFEIAKQGWGAIPFVNAANAADSIAGCWGAWRMSVLFGFSLLAMLLLKGYDLVAFN